MKNITLSAEESLIRRARERAEAENTTLNAQFRDWLESYVERPRTGSQFAELMAQFDYVRTGRAYTRDEMNER